MAVALDIPLTVEQQLNNLTDSVRGLQVQLAQHADGLYPNFAVPAGKTFLGTPYTYDVETLLGRKASQMDIYSEDFDIKVKLNENDADAANYLYVHSGMWVTVDIHKISFLYIENALSGAVETTVRLKLA